ncbi:UDP-N-acetylmuramoyl-tripeptide--D-alanyl-D-alanine ligase [Alphaproteobacteria bacterium]|nr:UDP-N-acetylmuramoyl-tripeptide--D-alanyl-D-alanine ligase [Alphaproteobacteria bacterium]MDC0147840.1 UDP-N-acetylmuramoyl-tripeptide--D-alanyl-D-alanine ligase [Alphaproteobacteria bacterium]
MSNSGRDILWDSDALSAALGDLLQVPIQADGQAILGISIDTRTLEAGDLFVALNGDNADGHRYVARALGAGASAALVQHGVAIQDLPEDAPLVVVSDVMQALEALAVAARGRTSAHIIGVTGSVGKTSVKEALRFALARSGKVHASEKSYNNHIGVPLTLARMPADCEFGVFEIGMNHAGEINHLVGLVQPHCAIITQIGTAHIENFASMHDLALAKAEILSGVVAGGAAILPADSEHLDLLRQAASAQKIETIITFGLPRENLEAPDAVANKVKLHPACSCVSAKILADNITYKIATPGEHHVVNSLAVLAAVSLARADLAFAALSLADNDGLAGRGKRHHIETANGEITLIDESYNANPTSMAAAITTLGLMPRTGRGRRIAVLGDMAELGAQGAQMHGQLAEIIAGAEIDAVISCGPLMQTLHNQLPASCVGFHAADVAAVTRHLIADLRMDDVVMVKGSNASGMGAVVDALVRSEDVDASLQPERMAK